ncbi:DUF3455 domain-containing protein [Spirilliplanes yamanashiensis]|uniref:DUF3455 domain-containing protein n=1 Tax=Spirilliplanes yamanashiensis TaxID=42233 RepID=UPI001951CFE3|nr:DUF3455 domain-containing protein [Spirilliplanes yamanashiensis]MDP9817697.1 hypothetical protein [Spirilliplanes yamanashiensis]
MTRNAPSRPSPARTWIGAGAVAAALLVAWGGTAFSQERPAAQAADPAAAPEAAYGTPDVPGTLVPPPGHVLSATAAAQGVQVYRCASGAWSLLEPAATLAGRTAGRPARRVTAVHFRGPSWESTDDGSLVEAAAVASVPVEGTIAQVLLKATKNRGTGVFGAVSYVQRLATSGGVAPAGTCTDGATAGVPYRALYRFFTPAA